MTESEIRQLITLAVPKERQDGDVIAGLALKKALTKIGKMDGVNFNRQQVTFTLTAAQDEYVLGSDILAGLRGVWGFANLYRTDTPGWDIEFVGNEDFDRYDKGSTLTGPPVIATLYFKKNIKTLQFWPKPDAAYPIEGKAKIEVTNLEDIPDIYHDAVVDEAVDTIVALVNATRAAQKAQESAKELRRGSLTKWNGNTIPLERNLGENGNGARTDSKNLRG